MPLKLRSGFLKSSGKEALLLMDAGNGDQIIMVTREALETIASPPRADEFRLQEHIETLGAIASSKYDAGIIQPDGRVWITVDDIRSWKAAHAA